MKRLLEISLLAALLAAGCVTESDAPHLFAGMSRERVRARFGEPLRVEQAPAGGEDWYYSFSSSPEIQGSTYHDYQTGSDSVSASVSVSDEKVERPVHLSPEGYVVEPLPSGHIVR